MPRYRAATTGQDDDRDLAFGAGLVLAVVGLERHELLPPLRAFLAMGLARADRDRAGAELHARARCRAQGVHQAGWCRRAPEQPAAALPVDPGMSLPERLDERPYARVRSFGASASSASGRLV